MDRSLEKLSKQASGYRFQKHVEHEYTALSLVGHVFLDEQVELLDITNN